MHLSCYITRNTFFHLEQKWDSHPEFRPLVILAATVALVATPIFLSADVIRSIYRSCIKEIPSSDYHYFFSTPIFSDYEKQLRQFIKNETDNLPMLADLDLVRWISKPIKDKHLFYQGVLLRLRALVHQKTMLDPEIAEFTERACCWIYTGSNLLPTMTDWVKGHMNDEEKRGLSYGKIHEVIKNLHSRWKLDARFQGEIFQDYRPYDPRYLGDTPSFFFRVGDTQIIRTPAITRDKGRSFWGTLNEASIVEEFLGFLQHYKRQEKVHLYVNLMASHGSEKIRNKALEDLESKYSNVFHLITLSKDCIFYHQTDRFAHQNEAELFKKDFINQMFNDSSAFHWPVSWDRDETKIRCLEAIEKVHANYFGSASLLNLEQRRRFIELAYTEIIESFLVENKPATCNISCRSCVDRGAANLSLLYAKTHPLKKPESRETLAVMALAPAMIAQSRQMLDHRMFRLSEALDQLLYQK